MGLESIAKWVQNNILGLTDADWKCGVEITIKERAFGGSGGVVKSPIENAYSCRRMRKGSEVAKEMLANPNPTFRQMVGMIWRGL